VASSASTTGRRRSTGPGDALAIALTPAEVAALEDAVPACAVAGTRYGEAMMAHLDSER
jgi:hypothetical protein